MSNTNSLLEKLETISYNQETETFEDGLDCYHKDSQLSKIYYRKLKLDEIISIRKVLTSLKK